MPFLTSSGTVVEMSQDKHRGTYGSMLNVSKQDHHVGFHANMQMGLLKKPTPRSCARNLFAA